MSNILKLIGVFIVGGLLLLGVASITGVVSIGVVFDVSSESFWDNYRNKLALLIIDALIILGLVGQIENMARRPLSDLVCLAILGMVLLTVLIPFQGGLASSFFLVIGALLIIVLSIILLGCGFDEKMPLYAPRNTFPLVFLALLIICTPALTYKLLISCIASWIILGITLIVNYGASSSTDNKAEN